MRVQVHDKQALAVEVQRKRLRLPGARVALALHESQRILPQGGAARRAG
jgi:hypothetical protein